MENSGELIIYIVLMIIFIVKALLDSGNKKKKQQKQILGPVGKETEVNEEPQGENFWDLLDEMQNKPVQTEPSVSKTSKAQIKRQTLKENRVVSSHTSKNASKTSLDKTMPSNITEAEYDYNKITEESFHDVEELRKAIIYTEILNRKY